MNCSQKINMAVVLVSFVSSWHSQDHQRRRNLNLCPLGKSVGNFFFNNWCDGGQPTMSSVSLQWVDPSRNVVLGHKKKTEAQEHIDIISSHSLFQFMPPSFSPVWIPALTSIRDGLRSRHVSLNFLSQVDFGIYHTNRK